MARPENYPYVDVPIDPLLADKFRGRTEGQCQEVLLLGDIHSAVPCQSIPGYTVPCNYPNKECWTDIPAPKCRS